MTVVTGSSFRIPFSEVTVEEVSNPIPASNVLTVGQVQHLFSLPEPNTAEEIRARAILSLTVMCDLTVDEINQLEVSDLDLSNRILIVLGRSGVERQVELSNVACDLLEEWLEIRNQINVEDEQLFAPVFKPFEQ